jgi:hypothetical protein
MKTFRKELTIHTNKNVMQGKIILLLFANFSDSAVRRSQTDVFDIRDQFLSHTT